MSEISLKHENFWSPLRSERMTFHPRLQECHVAVIFVDNSKWSNYILIIVLNIFGKKWARVDGYSIEGRGDAYVNINSLKQRCKVSLSEDTQVDELVQKVKTAILSSKREWLEQGFTSREAQQKLREFGITKSGEECWVELGRKFAKEEGYSSNTIELDGILFKPSWYVRGHGIYIRGNEIAAGASKKVFSCLHLRESQEVFSSDIVLIILNNHNALYDPIKWENEIIQKCNSSVLPPKYSVLKEGSHFTSIAYFTSVRRVKIAAQEKFDGTLEDFVDRLSFKDKLVVAVGVSKALETLHSNQIVHRDIKPSNILLKVAATTHEVSKVVLSDFDVAATVDGSQPFHDAYKLRAGTFQYMPPEDIGRDPRQSIPQTKQGDVYSLGLVLHYIFSSDPSSRETTFHEDENGGYRRLPHMPMTTSGPIKYNLYEFSIFPALRKEPNLRPSAQEIARNLQSILTSLG